MIVEITGNLVTLIREAHDERIRDESDLFHKLKKVLNAQGEDLIKKTPSSDGHLTSAPYYLRDRGWAYCIIDNEYALRDVAKEYRETGRAQLMKVEWERPMLQPELFERP